MKTAISKLIITLIPFIAMALLVTVAVGLSRKAERIQTAAVSQQQSESKLFGSSCDNLLNNLFVAGGR